MKVWKNKNELTVQDLKHLEIRKTLDDLEVLGPKVATGFIIFWVMLTIAFIWWIFGYAVPTVQGWF